MERRKFLGKATGGIAAAAILTTSAKVMAQEHQHDHNGPKLDSDLILGEAGIAEYLKAVVETTHQCLKVGRVCDQHCFEQILSGNHEMYGACAIAVKQMITLCDAIGSLAAAKSIRLKECIRACIAACESCADACKPHIHHHMECKACYEACQACMESCTRLALELGV